MTNEGENPQQPNGEDIGNNEEPVEQDLGKAAEDEFTSKFLVSTEEEEEGFYRMRGELGGFEILMPKDAELSDVMHQITDESVENHSFAYDDIERKSTVIVNLLYQEGFSEKVKENYLSTYKQRIGFEGEYLETESDNIEFYTGYVENQYKDFSPDHIYLGYLFSRTSGRALIVEYIVSCIEEECEISLNEEEERANKLMNSVDFK